MCLNDVGKSIIGNSIAVIDLEGRKQNKTEVIAILWHTVIVFHTFMPVGKHMIWYVLVQSKYQDYWGHELRGNY